MANVPQVLILIAGAVLLTLVLGLPLLLRKDSLIPDMIGLVILGVVVLGFVWLTGLWWTLVPVLAIAALVAWMDGKPEETPHPQTGMSERTRARFRLWQASNWLNFILFGLIILAMATGGGGGSGMRVVPPLLLVMLVASSAFRFSYNRSIRSEPRAAGEPLSPAEAT
jgi:hypothetical protein